MIHITPSLLEGARNVAILHCMRGSKHGTATDLILLQSER